MSDHQQDPNVRKPRVVNREPDEDALASPVDEVDDQDNEAIAGKGLPEWANWAPGRTKLALALGPIVAIPLIVTPIMWVGRPWLATNHPLILMALSNKVVNLALATIQVSAIAFYLVAVLRRVVFAPCYFFVGRWGADRGLEWMAQNSPSSSKLLARLRRWFPTFGPLLIIFYPAPIVRVLAGASNMRFWVFWTYEWIGAIAVAVTVRTLGFQFPDQLDAVLDFIKKYTWQLTIGSFAYIALVTYLGERKNARNASLDEDDDLSDGKEVADDDKQQGPCS